MSLLLSKVTPAVIRSSKSSAMWPRRWSLFALSVSSGESRSSGWEMSVLRSTIGPSVDVALVAVLDREAADIIFGRFARLTAFVLDHLQERFVDDARHLLLVAADVEMRAFLEPGIKLARLFDHAVLDIDLVGAVAREGDVEASENAVFQPLLPFDLIEEVAAQVALAEEQPRPSGGGARFAFLKEAAERRDSGAWPDHDDRHVVA